MNKGKEYLSYMSYMTSILIIGYVASGCGSKDSSEVKNETRKVEYFYEPEPEYQPPLYPLPNLPDPEPVKVQEEQVKEAVKVQEKPAPQPVKEITISKYYEEGYENGYDDGEDDAVMDNGFGGQFDDENHYKGQKKKDYELGYEEGYEAGYYDVREGD